MKAALYARVSSNDQTTENQEPDLRAFAERIGAEVVGYYRDVASGARSNRAQFRALLEAARLRQFDTLLIWSLDRLSREGIAPMLGYLEQLHRAGVRVMSLREGWVDTDAPTWDLMVAVFAWVAKQERQRIRERVLAGMARARAKGTKSGRPIGRPLRPLDLADLRNRRLAGQSWARIAQATRTPMSTLRSRLRPAKIPIAAAG